MSKYESDISDVPLEKHFPYIVRIGIEIGIHETVNDQEKEKGGIWEISDDKEDYKNKLLDKCIDQYELDIPKKAPAPEPKPKGFKMKSFKYMKPRSSKKRKSRRR